MTEERLPVAPGLYSVLLRKLSGIRVAHIRGTKASLGPGRTRPGRQQRSSHPNSISALAAATSSGQDPASPALLAAASVSPSSAFSGSQILLHL